MLAQSSMRMKGFISYGHCDAKWLERLRVHLNPLVLEQLIETWDDTLVEAGSCWREEIARTLATTKVPCRSSMQTSLPQSNLCNVTRRFTYA